LLIVQKAFEANSDLDANDRRFDKDHFSAFARRPREQNKNKIDPSELQANEGFGFEKPVNSRRK
jgi:hypothetical protein